ncbi:MAG: AI-2E family transporter [Synechococcaceae cyanobacterium SM2_3_2]|nr:AI-2E family transporter [Synechococcaceae cyanobacterium SM2_3_2]
MSSNPRFSITWPGLWLFAAALLLSILLWQLRSLVVTLMISVVLAATLAPIIDSAQKLKLPRWLAVVVVYLGLIAVVVGAGLIIGPTVVTQIQRLTLKLPSYLEELRLLIEAWVTRFGVEETIFDQLIDTQALTSWLIRSSQQLIIRSVGLTRGIVGAFINLILAIVISGYMLSGSQSLIKGLVSLFPYPWDRRLAAQMDPAAQRMGGYIQGRVVVSGILGLVITFGLRVLGLSEFALALGVIAGFTNLIPFIGPVLGALPALVVAVSQGGWTVLWVLVLYLIIQNVETYVLDPLLVGSSVRVHPLYQLLAVIAGTQVLGIIGALIVPPWVAGAAVLLQNLYLRPKLLSERRMAAGLGNKGKGSSNSPHEDPSEAKSLLEGIPEESATI